MNGQESEHLKYNHIYLIKVAFKDGSNSFPVKISQNEININYQISDANMYFSEEYKGNGIVTVFSSTIQEYNFAEIMDWKAYRNKLFEYQDEDKTHLFITNLNRLGVAAWVISLIDKDLRCEENEKLFHDLIQANIGDEKQLFMTKKALEVARKAHRGQTQKRPQDTDGLDNVPYLNHVIQVAIFSLKHNLSPEAVQASLLHDVVEDTDVSLEDLAEEGFSGYTLGLVDALTKQPEEQREEFLERVGRMTGEAKLIKSFDRYHNLIRAFSVPDSNYLSRVINESEAHYLSYFYSIPKLANLAPTFKNLLEETKKFKKIVDQQIV